MKKFNLIFFLKSIICLLLFSIFLAIVWIVWFEYHPMPLVNAVNVCRSLKEVSRRREAFRHVQKYNYALKNKLPENLRPDGRYKDYVWTLWLGGENEAPQIIKNCFKSMRKYLGNRRLIVLDEQSISKYIGIPDYILEKYKKGIITPTSFSDIVRYCLLYKYGGLWLDSTILLTGPFPDKILEQPFFMFSQPALIRLNKFLTTTWIVRSMPANAILKDIINLYFEYWLHEEKIVDYYFIFFFFTMAVENDPEARAIFEKMPCICEQYHFFSSYVFPYEQGLLRRFIKYARYPLHKLTYKDTIFMQKGWVSKDHYERSLLHFFSRKDALEQLQEMGLAEK